MDWTTIIVAACAAVAPTIMALAAWRAAKHTAVKVEEVHQATNGRMDQLVETTRRLAFAEGWKQGIEQGRAEKKKEVL